MMQTVVFEARGCCYQLSQLLAVTQLSLVKILYPERFAQMTGDDQNALLQIFLDRYLLPLGRLDQAGKSAEGSS